MTMLSLTPLRPVGRKIIDMSLQRRSEQIAPALTAPDAVGELVKLANYEPNSVTASFYVAAMLGSGATDDQQYPTQVAQ